MEQATEPSQQAVVKALLGARDAMLEIRNRMRQMGEAAGIPVCSFFHFFFLLNFGKMTFMFLNYHNCFILVPLLSNI